MRSTGRVGRRRQLLPLHLRARQGGRQQQPQQDPTTTNERTALLRKAATTTTPLTASSLGAAGGTSVGSGGSAGGSPPPAPLAATLSSEAQRKERLAQKYDSDGDEEAGAGSVVGMLQRPRPRRSSSASSSSNGQGPAQGGSGNGGGAVVTIAIPPSSSSLGAGAEGPRVYGAVPWTLVVPVYVDRCVRVWEGEAVDGWIDGWMVQRLDGLLLLVPGPTFCLSYQTTQTSKKLDGRPHIPNTTQHIKSLTYPPHPNTTPPKHPLTYPLHTTPPKTFKTSLMDGLLIGLSAVAGQSAGLVMSVALTIEMGFLGLTFSAGVGKVIRQPGSQGHEVSWLIRPND